MQKKIMIIEDDKGIGFFLKEALGEEGYNISVFESVEDAIPALSRDTDLIILDIKLPGMDGLTAIDLIKRITDIPVIISTAYGTRKNAQEAMKKGADDFFVKPVPLEELKVVVSRTIKRYEIKREIEIQKAKKYEDQQFKGVVGVSPKMKEIFRVVKRIADKDITLMITGETGVGKEVIASLIHELSGRKGAFVAVNCASIPDTLLESELFGYEKGAFTGATKDKLGKIEVANNGTLLLDEIGEMSVYLQAKMLRFVEQKEIERLGGTKGRPVNVRIISATNKDLKEEISKGRFREDLYYRLAGAHINIPPLRERKEDMGLLIEYFIEEMEREYKQRLRLDEAAMDFLLGYDWPGNIRELKAVIKSAAAICENGLITYEDLPLHMLSTQDKGDLMFNAQLDVLIERFERDRLIEALKRTKGRQKQAAELLGITERSIWYRIKKHNIDMNEI